jgi:hypothetical protein
MLMHFVIKIDHGIPTTMTLLIQYVCSVFSNDPADNPGNYRVYLFKDGSLWHTPWVIKEDMIDVSDQKFDTLPG